MSALLEVHYTNREMQIIKQILLGIQRKVIPSLIGMDDDTIGNHFKNLFLKTGSHSIGDLLVYLLSHGFVVNRQRTEVTYNGVIL